MKPHPRTAHLRPTLLNQADDPRRQQGHCGAVAGPSRRHRKARYLRMEDMPCRLASFGRRQAKFNHQNWVFDCNIWIKIYYTPLYYTPLGRPHLLATGQKLGLQPNHRKQSPSHIPSQCSHQPSFLNRCLINGCSGPPEVEALVPAAPHGSQWAPRSLHRATRCTQRAQGFPKTIGRWFQHIPNNEE